MSTFRFVLGAALALATAALLAPSFRAAGSPFDEGILVSFPTRVLAGDIPYRDFETFYGYDVLARCR